MRGSGLCHPNSCDENAESKRSNNPRSETLRSQCVAFELLRAANRKLFRRDLKSDRAPGTNRRGHERNSTRKRSGETVTSQSRIKHSANSREVNWPISNN